jgi:hypothetical protein
LRGVKNVIREKGKGEGKECSAYVHMVGGVVWLSFLACAQEKSILLKTITTHRATSLTR